MLDYIDLFLFLVETGLSRNEASVMEEDRAMADLGPDLDDNLTEDPEAVPKVPKRRFIGKKSADAKAAARVDPAIEGTGAVQGGHCNSFLSVEHR